MSDFKSPIRINQTDFRSGEVDPRLIARNDSKLYPSGALTLTNGLIAASGSVSRRPGTTRIAALSGKRRLIAFEFDADEKYLFAFGTNALNIYDGNGTLLTSFSGSTNCPWGTEEVWQAMTFAQAGDVTIICHRNFRPKIVRRTGLTSFSISNFSFDESPNAAKIYQPYIKYESAAVTLAISATTAGASRTVTASSGIFSSSWVGDTIRIYGIECTVTGYTNTTTITVTVKQDITVRLDPNPLQFTNGSGTIEVLHVFHGMNTGASVTISGANDSYGITRGNIDGARTVTVVDEDHYTFAAAAGTASTSADGGGSAIKVATTSATRVWDEPAFSARRGWPAACCFHEDRLWFGGTTAAPDGLWASRTGQYFNFDTANGVDDGSIQLTIGSPRIAQIRHILSNRVLQVFTEGAEFVARQSDGAAMTPSTVSIRPQTPYGTTNVRPRSFDGATLFVQSNGKTVREFTYAFGEDAFQAVELTTLSSHLVDNIISCDVLYGTASRTEQYAFFVNGNGTLGVFHSNRSEELASWAPWETRSGDVIESVAVLATKAYLSVLRNGTRYLERLEFDSPSITLDSATSLTSATPTSTWTLGSGYASQVIHVTSNGWYLGSFTANGSGVIETGLPLTAVTCGYNFDWVVTPLPVDLQIADGPMTGVPRRVSSVTAHFYQTLSASINQNPVIIAQINDDLSVPPTAYSGKVQKFLFGYNRDPAVTFTQSAPLPVTLLGMTMEVSL